MSSEESSVVCLTVLPAGRQEVGSSTPGGLLWKHLVVFFTSTPIIFLIPG